MKTTPLHSAHTQNKAKMGEFAGYDMPLYYSEGVIAEHEWVRGQCGAFDVSHMRQVVISGPGAMAFLETITPSSYDKAPPGRAKYTVMTNPEGGIVDDLIVTRLGEERFFAVINAGCRDKDIEWMRAHLPETVTLDCLDNRALIAVQGPKAEAVLKDVLAFDASDMPYMWLAEAKTPDGADIYISRVGYTGEDGFEVSIASDSAADLWSKLLAHGSVKPIGLAARDSLRLEMGYCLYGHDIDTKTTPIEAGLGWVMGKDNTGFIGAQAVLRHKNDGPPRCRVGIRLLDKGVAREGAVILSEEGEQLGVMTSGSFSPTLKQSIGQGYVPAASAAAGTKIMVDVRGRKIAAEIAPMPFLPANTKSMKKQAAA